MAFVQKTHPAHHAVVQGLRVQNSHHALGIIFPQAEVIKNHLAFEHSLVQIHKGGYQLGAVGRKADVHRIAVLGEQGLDGDLQIGTVLVEHIDVAGLGILGKRGHHALGGHRHPHDGKQRRGLSLASALVADIDTRPLLVRHGSELPVDRDDRGLHLIALVPDHLTLGVQIGNAVLGVL